MSEKKDKPKSSLAVSPIPLALTGLEPTDAPGDVVSVLLFEVGGEVFGIGVEHTEGVVDCPRVTPLPSAPDAIIGVASVRGRMTLVMDCSLKANADEGKRRLILLKGESQLGLLAERVEGIVALDPEKIRKRKGEDKTAAHFQHEGRRVPLLDAARLVTV